MILEKGAADIPLCVSRAEAAYNENNKAMVLMNCYDAIL